MSLTELEIAFFLPVVLLVYWLLPRRAPVQNAWLLAISWLFYASWSPRLLLLLLAGAALDFVVSNAMGEPPEEGDAPGRRRRVRLLGASLAFNLGALGFFKYAGFFAASLDALFTRVGITGTLPVLHLVLPLGISFYTLQRIGYVVDVYYGRIPACRSPLTFALFASWFPQVTAGPISRGGQLLPQLEAPRTLDAATLASAVGTFFFGFALKTYVADYLGTYLVDPVFAAPAGFSVLAHWAAMVGYAAQIFADFAGYSLVAIGASRLFAIELPQNFAFPFLSRSLTEFWRRWHITLNSWLFEYIYGPLTTGPLRGRFDASLLIVFLASGLWHGAAYTFLLWGLLHGVGMVVQRHWDEYYRSLCRRDRRWVARRNRFAYRAAAWALTQGWFVLTLVPFRAASAAQLGEVMRGLVRSSGTQMVPLGLNVLVCLGVVVGWHLTEVGWLRRLPERFFALPAPVRGVAYGLVIAWLLIFVPVGASTFIYRQF